MNIDPAQLISMAVSWAPKIVGAILVLMIGFWIVGRIAKMAGNAMAKSGLDKDVVPFLTSLITVLLKVMVVVSAAGIVGIETTAFVGLIAAAGLAVGMALSLIHI